jgi:hypothetical protein
MADVTMSRYVTPNQSDDQIVFDDYVAANWRNTEPITPVIIGVTDRLVHSSNIMTGGTCDELSLPRGSTYAEGVRELKEWWAVR